MPSLIYRDTKGANLTPDEGDANMRALNSAVEAKETHPYYHFHGYAPNQFAGDSVFFDFAAGNHGVRGVNLSDAAMFTNAGYVSTLSPSGANTDSCIRIPGLNFDYAGGEKLFIYWKGIAAGNGLGAESAIMGDGWATNATQKGIQIRTTVLGKVYVTLLGATSAGFGLGSANVVFDGTNPHDFAFLIDGENKQYGMWTDGVMDSQFAATYKSFSSGTSFDTKNSNTFNLGAGQAAPGTLTQPQGGEATKTRTFVIIRMPATYTIPSVSRVNSVIQTLRASPGKFLFASAL